jgi:hypothetical protein
MALARGYLWFCVIMSVVFGGLYVVAPEAITEPMGIQAVTSAGSTDLRATYGGFQLAMAGFLLWCLRDPARIDAGLVAFAFLVGGLAVCRGVGLLIDGISSEMVGAMVMELGLAGFTLFVRARLGSASPVGAA